MKERPILMSAPMVRALLAGTKTQTRRVVKLKHNNPLGEWEPTTIGGPNGGRLANGETIPLQGAIWHTRTGECLASPYGQPGDRLWVRETWAEVARTVPSTGEDLPMRSDGRILVYRADPEWNGARQFACADGCLRWANPSVWRPSIYMPRWAGRIDLEVTSVRVERLQDISEQDAIAEGIEDTGNPVWFAVDEYQFLWESINGPGSWDANPWVWCVTFKRISKD